MLIATADDAPLAEDALEWTIRPFGGHMEQFADGSTIEVVDAEGKVTTDQAA